MRPQFSLAHVFKFVTLLCVSLGMTISMGTTGTMIVAGSIYLVAPIYAFATYRFRDAFQMYVEWNLLCAFVVVASAMVSLFGQWFPAFQVDTDFREGFLMWTALASGPCGLAMALLILVEFPAINRINEATEIFFCLAAMAMWICIWRYFLKCHQRAVPKGVIAEATNYLLFLLLLVPVFAVIGFFTCWVFLLAVAPHM